MKKGMLPLQLVVLIIILLVALAVVIVWFTGTFRKQAGVIGTELNKLYDCDCDGIRNMLDKCPCIYAETENGCPEGQSAAGCSQEQIKTCNKYGYIPGGHCPAAPPEK